MFGSTDPDKVLSRNNAQESLSYVLVACPALDEDRGETRHAFEFDLAPCTVQYYFKLRAYVTAIKEHMHFSFAYVVAHDTDELSCKWSQEAMYPCGWALQRSPTSESPEQIVPIQRVLGRFKRTIVDTKIEGNNVPYLGIVPILTYCAPTSGMLKYRSLY